MWSSLKREWDQEALHRRITQTRVMGTGKSSSKNERNGITEFDLFVLLLEYCDNIITLKAVKGTLEGGESVTACTIANECGRLNSQGVKSWKIVVVVVVGETIEISKVVSQIGSLARKEVRRIRRGVRVCRCRRLTAFLSGDIWVGRGGRRNGWRAL